MHAARRLSLALFLAALALVGVRAPAVAQTVSGVVTNQEGAAVAGVAVSLRTVDGDVETGTLSAGNGRYTLEIPQSGEYRIHADAAGHLPTVSHLFDLRGEGLYQIDVEVHATQTGIGIGGLYAEWGRSNIHEWTTRDVVILSGAQWREISAGRDLVEALEMADFPGVSIQRRPLEFCPRFESDFNCMKVLRLTDGPERLLRDVTPDDVEAVVYVGPTVTGVSRGTDMGWRETTVNPSLILFMHGYFSARN